MRIAYFSDSLPPVTDGVAHTLQHLATTLASDGIDFRFVSAVGPVASSAWAEKVLRTYSVPFALYDYYRVGLPYVQGLPDRLDAFAPDLVHVVSPTPLGIWGLDYAESRHIPAVGSYHTDFLAYLPYYRLGGLEPLARAFLGWFYGRCRVVYPPSAVMARELRRQGIDRIELWQRGIEMDRFSPVHRDDELRRRIGLGPEEKLILFVGRLVEEKDIDVLLRAAAMLEERGIAFRLAFVGDGPMAAEIARRKPDALLPGFLHGEDLSRWYASSDVFAFPSTTETFGNVILEAGASGLPVVCCRSGGPIDLVRPGETGFLAEPGDASGFATALERLLASPEEARRMGRAGRRYAARFDWQAVNRSLVDSYRRVIESTPGRERRTLFVATSSGAERDESTAAPVGPPAMVSASRAPTSAKGTSGRPGDSRRTCRRVVVLLADGLRPDVVRPHIMPSLFAIGKDHTRFMNARTIAPSVTIAALTSLGTGVPPRRHGLTSPGLGILPRLASLDPLSTQVRRAGMRTTVFCTAIPLQQAALARLLTRVVGIDLVLKGSRAREVAAAATDRIGFLDDGLVFVYVTDCDVAGHAHGWMSEPYMRAAEEVDVAVARLGDRLGDDLLIVLADHGGGGVSPRDHDLPHPVNSHIPLILAGTGVRRETIIAEEASLLDVPATILWRLGLDVPASYAGSPLTAAFGESPAPRLGAR